MAVLTFRVEDVSPEGALEFALGNTHWLDGFKPPREHQLKRLAHAVKALLAEPSPGRPTVAFVRPARRRTGRRKATRLVSVGFVAIVTAIGVNGFLGRPIDPRPIDDGRKPTPTTEPGKTPTPPKVDNTRITNNSTTLTSSGKTPPPRKIHDPLITNTIGMTMKLIPPGEFEMGSDGTDPQAAYDEKVDGKKHPVRIAKPFYLGTTEVTVGQFRKFVERSNYKTEAERNGMGYGWNQAKSTFEQGPQYTWRSPGFPQTDDHPVVVVTYNDALALCSWLSKEEGQTYRLPTEAEWEYSCRAGQGSRFWFGDDPEGLAKVGNVADGTARERYPGWPAIKAKDGFIFTAPVGRFAANPFGLFDMHGNVWEWCSDWYGLDYYANSPPVDPAGPPDGMYRVIRGGAWSRAPEHGRAAYRSWYGQTNTSFNVGLRLVRVPSGK